MRAHVTDPMTRPSRLLERTQILGALASKWQDAVRGNGSVVLVTGEAGIGKTSVVRAFRESLGAVRILSGACDDLQTARAFGPLRDAAAASCGPLEDALAGGAGEEVFDGALTELRTQPPTLLIIEDLHWSDDATLDVLAFLARRIDSVAAMVLVTIRDGGAAPGHPLHRWLGSLAGLPVQRIVLPSLSTGAVAELADQTDWDAATLHELTGGNPFYVTEALAAPPDDAVPATVADAVLARVRQLDSASIDAVERLSVVPKLVEFELADVLLGDRIDHLTSAEDSGIVQVRSDGIAFRHELARRAVEASLSGLRRRTLHRNVIGALGAMPRPDLARLVHHGLAANDSATVIRYAARAGRESAAVGSHRQALAHFEAALRYADALSTVDLARLLDDYAWELYNAHRFSDAVDVGERAVARYLEVGDPVLLGEARVRLSRHHYMIGDTRRAVETSRAALEGLERTSSLGATAYAATSYGAVLALAGDTDEAAPVLDRALQLATESERVDLIELCLNYQSLVRRDVDQDGRIALLRKSLALALEHGHHEHAARAYTNLGEILYRSAKFDELDVCLRSALRFTAERGFGSHAFNLEVHQALLRIRRGDWQAGEDALAAIIDRAGDPGMLRVYSVPTYARLLARKNPDTDLTATLLGAWHTAVEQGSLLALSFAGPALAEYAWISGRTDLATMVFEQWQTVCDRPGAGPVWGEVLRYCARAGVDIGAAPLDDVPERWAAGLRRDAAAAVAQWETIGDPYERALELVEAGTPEQTREALSILDGLGAAATAATVRRQLKSHGMQVVPRGPHSSTKAHPAGLTARQADVLDLVAQGLTNAEIADRLFLSVRTVDHHVSSILGKLGVSTRRDAGAVARVL